MTTVPLQWLNDFLIDYNAGQVLVVVFLLSVLAVLPLKSRKVFALNLGVFGAIFALAPAAISTLEWRLVGVLMVVLAPLLYLTAQD